MGNGFKKMTFRLFQNFALAALERVKQHTILLHGAFFVRICLPRVLLVVIKSINRGTFLLARLMIPSQFYEDKMKLDKSRQNMMGRGISET